MLVDVAPQMNTHRLFAVEQFIRYTPYLTKDDFSNGPGITVLLQRADIQTNRLLDDIVLAIRHKKRPIRQVHYRRHNHDTGEEWCVVLQRSRQAD